MAQGTPIFDALLEDAIGRYMDMRELMTDTNKAYPMSKINNKFAREGFYYIDAYVDLINEIEEVTRNSRGMAMSKENLGELEHRLYYHFYQRLHSYGGFEWDTNSIGINPNQ